MYLRILREASRWGANVETSAVEEHRPENHQRESFEGQETCQAFAVSAIIVSYIHQKREEKKKGRM